MRNARALSLLWEQITRGYWLGQYPTLMVVLHFTISLTTLIQSSLIYECHKTALNKNTKVINKTFFENFGFAHLLQIIHRCPMVNYQVVHFEIHT